MDTTSPTITISFAQLGVVIPGERERRLLETVAPEKQKHIHGELNVLIHGRGVPYMGYWGIADVCFNQWITELTAIRKAFRGNVAATYTFDEGEQGQPAFHFVRNHDTMLLSIIDSRLSDGEAVDEWQQIAFSYQDFVQAYEQFKREFLAEIARVAPNSLTYWTQLFEKR